MLFRHVWRLSEAGADNLGLACNEEGLFLGRTPLLEWRDGCFVVRDAHDIRRLLGRAYQIDVEATPFLGGLVTVAAALNAKDLLLARIAAVHLRIPDLPDEAARERLEAEDRLIKTANSDWDPALHPRAGTPPNPGWFAPTDGGSDEDSARTRVADNSPSTQQSDASPEPSDDRVKLPDSDDDIDELHDLLEWIANAKPEDEAAIRAEIKKRFYDVGDTAGGDALNRALSDSLEAGNNKKARQEILDSIAPFAKNDPAIMGFLHELLPGVLVLPRAAIAGAEGEGAAAAEAEAGAAGAAENPWKMGWAARGKFFDKVFGKGTLNPLSRVIDEFEAGVATSRKSIDLNAATYQDYGRLTSRLNAYIDKLAEYTGTD
jgi:hypothetical protein